MKRVFLIIIACLLLAGVAYTDEWHPTNQATVRWDAVTALSDGSPVPAGDLVTYQLFTRSVQTGIEASVGPPVSTIESTITFTIEGDYHIGIRAIRTVPPAGELPERVFTSSMGWSSDPLIAKDGITFGVSYYLQPAGVSGLEAQ